MFKLLCEIWIKLCKQINVNLFFDPTSKSNLHNSPFSAIIWLLTLLALKYEYLVVEKPEFEVKNGKIGLERVNTTRDQQTWTVTVPRPVYVLCIIM